MIPVSGVIIREKVEDVNPIVYKDENGEEVEILYFMYVDDIHLALTDTKVYKLVDNVLRNCEMFDIDYILYLELDYEEHVEVAVKRKS